MTFTFLLSRRLPERPEQEPAGKVECVRLTVLTEPLRPYWFVTGIGEGTIGDDVLVRFGEVVVQVPPEMVEVVRM